MEATQEYDEVGNFRGLEFRDYDELSDQWKSGAITSEAVMEAGERGLLDLVMARNGHIACSARTSDILAERHFADAGCGWLGCGR